MNLHEQLFTSTGYATEDDAKAAFDVIVERHPDVFGVFKEVTGWYLQPRFNSESRTPRIDRILVPKPRLIEAGWTHGPIGVECKCSGKKTGPAICQCMDYGRAVFRIDSGCRPRIALEWIFLWPVEGTGGDIESVMLQHRIGRVSVNHRGDLVFAAGGYRAISVGKDGSLFARELKMGRKVGTR